MKRPQEIPREEDINRTLKDIGASVRDYRSKRNNTQEVFAEDAGVTIDVIKRIEAGKPVSGSNLIRVLKEANLLRLSDDGILCAVLQGVQAIDAKVATIEQELLMKK